jgi:hypothetical protein
VLVLDDEEVDDLKVPFDEPDEPLPLPQLELALFSAACAAAMALSTRCWPDVTACRAGPRFVELDDERLLWLADDVDALLDADDEPFDDPLPEVDTPFSALFSVSWAAASVACWAVSCACRALVSRAASVWPAVTA